MPHTPQEVSALLLRFCIGVIDMTADHKGEMLAPWRIAGLLRMLVVELKQVFGDIQGGEEGRIGIAPLRRPLDRLRASRARHPDGRVGLLNRHHPRVDDPEMKMLTFPAEGPRSRPGFDQEVVAFL